MRRIAAAASLLLTPILLAQSVAPAPATDNSVSAPVVTDSNTVIAYAHAAEADPLSPSAHVQLVEAVRFILTDPNIPLRICGKNEVEYLRGIKAEHFAEGDLRLIAFAGAFAYQHPDADAIEQEFAAEVGYINVYLKLVAAHAIQRNPIDDAQVQMRDNGTLKADLSAKCKTGD